MQHTIGGKDLKRLALLVVGFIFLYGGTGSCNEITIRVPDRNTYHPFFIQSQNGKWGGLSIELAEALLQESGHTPVYEPRPFIRGLKSVQQGKIDMMLNMTITEERRQFMHFIGPQLDESVFLVVLKDSNFLITSLDDLKKLPQPIGVERGKVYAKDFEKKRAEDEAFKNHLDEVTEIDKNESKLAAGRISGFLGFGYNVFYQIKTNPLYKDFTVHPFTISQDWVYFGFSKKSVSKERLREFQEAYDRANKKRVFEKIRKRYRNQ